MVELRKIFHFLLGKNVDGHQLKAVDNLPPEMRLNNDVRKLVDRYKDQIEQYGSPTYELAQLAGMVIDQYGLDPTRLKVDVDEKKRQEEVWSGWENFFTIKGMDMHMLITDRYTAEGYVEHGQPEIDFYGGNGITAKECLVALNRFILIFLRDGRKSY